MPTVVYGYFALLFVTPLLQTIPARPADLQHAERRHRHRHHDHPLRQLAERGRDAGGAEAAARGLLRDRCHQAADGLEGRGPGRDLRHRGRLRAWHLARRRRDDDRGDRRRPAAEPDLEPDGAGGDDHRLHRPGGAGRPAARQHRLPVDLRRRPDAHADHAGLQPHRARPAHALSGRPTDGGAGCSQVRRGTGPSVTEATRPTSPGASAGTGSSRWSASPPPWSACSSSARSCVKPRAIDGVCRGSSWEFFTSFPSRRAAQAGILSAWVGTLLVMCVTAADRRAARRRRRHLPRGVRAEELAHRAHRDQRHQPRRRALDRLRPPGAGPLRLRRSASAAACSAPG